MNAPADGGEPSQHRATVASPTPLPALFERISVESEEGKGSTSSREEISAKLPPLVQEIRARHSTHGPCPFLHGSTLGKRVLYLGDTCCLHEAFMACCFAESATMIVEQGRGDGSEDIIREVQAIIPNWCASLGLPSVNLSLTLGSAARLGLHRSSLKSTLTSDFHTLSLSGADALSTPSGAPTAAQAGPARPMLASAGDCAAPMETQQGYSGRPSPGGNAVTVEPESMDVVIGCNVLWRQSREEVNTILGNIYSCLVPGGEFSCTEVLSDRRLGAAALSCSALISGGLASTLYVEDFKRLAQQNGFMAVRLLNLQQFTPPDLEAQAALGNAKLLRATIRMFKLALLEPSCEDYGQVAIYRGTIPECEQEYQLDLHHVFVANQPKLVCGNTAAMLGDGGVSWLTPHFHIQGDRSVHFGLFSGTSLFDISEPKDKCCS